METKVVNIKSGQTYDVYIGRVNSFKELPDSIWKNPYIIGNHGDREYCIEKYRLYLNTRPDLLKNVKQLAGKSLGCWCFPENCHGNILKQLAESKYIRNWFSNMLPFDEPLIYQNMRFITVENFYQAMKLPKNRPDLRESISLMEPHKAKINIRNKIHYKWDESWNEEKSLKVMEYALKWKFKQGTSWYNKLKMTEIWEITEWNNWNDKFWGKDIITKEGENNLGKLLMRIRDND